MTITKNHAILEQEVATHIAAGQVVQGMYWDGDRGCFISCLTHSSDPQPAVDRFGLTTPILFIAESIFEALPEKDAQDFFAAIPDAVACDGKDLSLVHWAFLAEELRALPKQPDDIQRVIDPVIEGMGLLASGQDWPDAGSAARAARYAAPAARAAANAACAAGYAADAAADAADYAAEYDACDVARIRQRNTLLRLIQEAPILEAAE